MELYDAFDTIAEALARSLLQIGFSTLLSLASYVLTAISLYTIAKRRGLHNPWLAWIPVANVWLIGSLSDQFRYVTQGQNKAKRKWLLGLKIGSFLLAVLIAVQAIDLVSEVSAMLLDFYNPNSFPASVASSAISLVALLVPALALKVAYAVVRYMALFDVFKSLDPGNATLYLVLSILFSVTEPFFLIFNRNKDLGMPPRRQEPYDFAPFEA